MPRYTVTHSLLTAWLYALKDNPYSDTTTESEPLEDFLTVLRREPTPRTEAMQHGIDFEDLVTAIVNGGGDKDHIWYAGAEKVAEIVKGGPLQVKATCKLMVNGIDILLNGRLDSLKAGVIRDIKFSQGYQRGKYINSTQHPTYFELVPEATEFEYVVSNGADVWTERYTLGETNSIIPTISEFLDWLDATGLMDLYKEKWVVK